MTQDEMQKMLDQYGWDKIQQNIYQQNPGGWDEADRSTAGNKSSFVMPGLPVPKGMIVKTASGGGQFGTPEGFSYSVMDPDSYAKWLKNPSTPVYAFQINSKGQITKRDQVTHGGPSDAALMAVGAAIIGAGVYGGMSGAGGAANAGTGAAYNPALDLPGGLDIGAGGLGDIANLTGNLGQYQAGWGLPEIAANTPNLQSGPDYSHEGLNYPTPESTVGSPINSYAPTVPLNTPIPTVGTPGTPTPPTGLPSLSQLAKPATAAVGAITGGAGTGGTSDTLETGVSAGSNWSDLLRGLLGTGGAAALANESAADKAMLNPFAGHRAGYARELELEMAKPNDFDAMLRAELAKNNFYDERLRHLEANPSDITNLPGYEAGLQAIERRGAAQGWAGSGQMMTELSKYGDQAFNNERNFLANTALNNATNQRINTLAPLSTNNAQLLRQQQLAQLAGANFTPAVGAGITPALNMLGQSTGSGLSGLLGLLGGGGSTSGGTGGFLNQLTSWLGGTGTATPMPRPGSDQDWSSVDFINPGAEDTTVYRPTGNYDDTWGGTSNNTSFDADNWDLIGGATPRQMGATTVSAPNASQPLPQTSSIVRPTNSIDAWGQGFVGNSVIGTPTNPVAPTSASMTPWFSSTYQDAARTGTLNNSFTQTQQQTLAQRDAEMRSLYNAPDPASQVQYLQKYLEYNPGVDANTRASYINKISDLTNYGTYTPTDLQKQQFAALGRV